MITTRDPESMTTEERQQEVASILARGLLRRVCPAKAVVPDAGEKPSEVSPDGLDLPAKTRLSVAPRPAGERVASREPSTKGAT